MKKNLIRIQKSASRNYSGKLKPTPNYAVISEKGPDHAKIFKVGVYLGEKLAAEGEGLSKQEAEVEAAKNALKEMDYVS